MCDISYLLGTSMAISTAGGIYGAYASAEKGKSQQRYYDYLAKQSELEASLINPVTEANVMTVALEEGNAIKQIQTQGSQIQASQKAALAAQGVYSDSGSAQDILLNTMSKTKQDELAIRFNADMKILQMNSNAKIQKANLLSQAAMQRVSGVNAQTAGNYGAVATLLETTGRFADNWYAGKKAGAF